MALKDLQEELNTLVLTLAKGKGSGGSNDPFRKELNYLTHTYTYSEKILLDELLAIKNTFDKAGKRLKRDKSATSEYAQTAATAAFDAGNAQIQGGQMVLVGPDADMLKTFVRRAFAALNTKFEAKQKSKVGDTKFRLVKQGTVSTVIVRARKGKTPSVYGALSRAQGEVMKALKPDFKTLFEKGSRTIGGKELFNIGHRTAVVERKVDAVDSILAGFTKDIGEAKKLLQDETKAFRVQHKMNAIHNTEVKFKSGKLISKLRIRGDAESWFTNQVERASKETKVGQKGGWQREDIKDAKEESNTLLTRMRKIIKDQYAKAGAAGEGDKQRSDPLIQTMGEMIVNVSGIKRLARQGVVINNSRYKLKVPKSKPPIKAEKKWKQKGKVLKHKNPQVLSGFGAFKASTAFRRKGTTESSDSIAPLLALLNAKLPQTVAKNMGTPRLESQTGRFASSVRITDVNQTAQGFPSVGYTYQKNPYQIFEMGAGAAPWATTARDPRNLIDASIREVARELAVGRFYTRRV